MVHRFAHESRSRNDESKAVSPCPTTCYIPGTRSPRGPGNSRMIALNCPSCRRALNLPDHLQGSWVKCPACQQTFQAPATVIEAQVAEPVAERVPEVARPDP